MLSWGLNWSSKEKHNGKFDANILRRKSFALTMIYQFNLAQMKCSRDTAEIQPLLNAVPHTQRFAKSSAGFV